jgi:hypothetical protein
LKTKTLKIKIESVSMGVVMSEELKQIEMTEEIFLRVKLNCIVSSGALHCIIQYHNVNYPTYPPTVQFSCAR